MACDYNHKNVITNLVRAMEKWASLDEDAEGIPEEVWAAYLAGKEFLGEELPEHPVKVGRLVFDLGADPTDSSPYSHP